MYDSTSVTLLNQLRTNKQADSWQRFSEIYEPLLEGWLRRRGVSADVAEDVRQEVLTKVFQELGQFSHNGRTGAFRAWLRTVMANRLRTIERQRWKQKDADRPDWSHIVEQLAIEDSPLTQAWNAEHDAFLVQRLLDIVSSEFEPNTLLAFRRVVLEGQATTAVAAQLGISPNAVRVAQSRVLAALRRIGEGMLD